MGSGPGSFDVLPESFKRLESPHKRRWASLGDTIQCKIQTQDKTMGAILNTPESVAFANELLAKDEGWELVQRIRIS